VQQVPGKKVVWHVLDNHFSFTEDKSEWIGTDIQFEIARRGGKTEVKFTHVGLVPDYECYDVCSEGWGTYINGSLRALISTGRGRPNAGQALTEGERTLADHNYTTTFTVDQSPAEVFAAINDVRGWWSGDIEGSTDKLGAEFTYRYKDMHRSTQRITELVPGKRVAWHVTASQLNFAKDVAEWTGTDIIFDIARIGDKTELRFTHRGLVPEIECFDSCSDAWSFYVNGSLRTFIANRTSLSRRQERPARSADALGSVA
jgi:hypothetical protein